MFICILDNSFMIPLFAKLLCGSENLPMNQWLTQQMDRAGRGKKLLEQRMNFLTEYKMKILYNAADFSLERSLMKHHPRYFDMLWM